MLILVTGRSGVGKSAILKKVRFRNKVSMDFLVKKYFYRKGHPLFDQVVEMFGEGVVTRNRIDTTKLGPLVINNNKALIELSNLVHPHVISFLKSLEGKWIVEMAAYINYQEVYKDIFDKIILITRDNPDLSKKFNYTDKKKNPIPDIEVKYDYKVENNSTLKEAAKTVLALVKSL